MQYMLVFETYFCKSLFCSLDLQKPPMKKESSFFKLCSDRTNYWIM